MYIYCIMQKLDLKEFLKTYTAISNKFIDEYCHFYEICENEKIWYKCRNDYWILGNKSNQSILRKIKIKICVEYFILIDCFEKICLLSRTAKGDSVRDYFIILRKFINYYKTHFANALKKLAKNNKCVYIIMVDKDKWYEEKTLFTLHWQIKTSWY